MKVLLALAVLTTSAVSLASERAIYDIMYLPSAGTTFGISEAQYSKRTIDADAGETDISGYGVSQTIGHTLTDRFGLAVSMNYANFEVDPENDTKHDVKGLSIRILIFHIENIFIFF